MYLEHSVFLQRSDGRLEGLDVVLSQVSLHGLAVGVGLLHHVDRIVVLGLRDVLEANAASRLEDWEALALAEDCLNGDTV